MRRRVIFCRSSLLISSLAAGATLAAAPLHASTRSSIDYSVTAEAAGVSGGAGASADYSNVAAAGALGGVSQAAVPAETIKHGYVGQLYEVIGLVLDAVPTSVDEGQTRQLAASDLLDDATLLALNPASISWRVLNGPITSVSPSGVAAADVVYQTRNATIEGSNASHSATLLLSVLNVSVDNFGPYAGDQIDDGWQVQYFGENSSDAAPLLDPDGDGQNNRFEYIAGLIPTDGASMFRLRIEAVPGSAGQRRLIFSPRFTDRTYVPESRANLVLSAWEALQGASQQDNGQERTVTDVNGSGAAKFYRIRISKP